MSCIKYLALSLAIIGAPVYSQTEKQKENRSFCLGVGNLAFPIFFNRQDGQPLEIATKKLEQMADHFGRNSYQYLVTERAIIDAYRLKIGKSEQAKKDLITDYVQATIDNCLATLRDRE